MNVQKKAVHLIICNTKKGFRRCKRPNAETVRRQKPLEALQYARIVFNDSYGAHAIARPDKLVAKFFYNRRRIIPVSASHSRTAELTNASSTACRANVDWLITFRISA